MGSTLGSWVKIADNRFAFDAFLEKIESSSVKKINGKISDYVCLEDSYLHEGLKGRCYLAIISNDGEEHFHRCKADFCKSFTLSSGMPESKFGKSVEATYITGNYGDEDCFEDCDNWSFYYEVIEK